jgi:predicted phage terminase large subunit-like protein
MSLTATTVTGFTKSILASRFDSPKPTPDFHQELWELCCSDHQFVAIAAPRGSAKSTAVTHSYGLAKAVFRESPFTVILSRTEGQAADFLNDIKIELTENEALISHFSIGKIVKDSQTDLIVQFSDGVMFRLLVMGVESFKRGLKWRNMRPSLIILDDVEGDEAVLNRDRREKFSKLIDGAVIPSLSDEGIFRMVGTIMHMDSYLENVMPDPRDENTVRTELSMIHMVEGELWASAKFKAHNEDFSELLWPEKLSEIKLRTYRARYQKKGMLETYSQEYLNYPIDESTAYFKKDDFLPIEDEHRNRRKRYYSAADFAISKNERADYTVTGAVGVDEDGILYVEDIRRGRWDAKEIIDEMFSVQERYDPELYTVEAGQIEKSLGPFLKAEMGTSRRNGVYINLNPMVPTKDKQSRARSFQARMRAGKVRFDKEAEWYPALESEMLRFPKDINDDQVDFLAWIGLTLDMIIDADTDKEYEDDMWDEEFGGYDEGRSAITGY